MNINPTKFQDILRLYKQGYVIWYDESKNDVITPAKDWCAKDVDIMLHETDFSYAAIIKRYQEHKDYFRFIHEMNMSTAVNALKEQVKNSDTAKLQKTIKDLENENELLFNENLLLKRTTDEPSYDELKSMYDKAIAEINELKSTAESQSSILSNQQNETEHEQKEYIGEPDIKTSETPYNLMDVDITTPRHCGLIFNIIVNGICYCTIYRTFDNPPIDGINQCAMSMVHVDSFTQSVHDILEYDSGNVIVVAGGKCIFNGPVSNGNNYDKIDELIDKLSKEIGDDIVEVANYIDFNIVDAPTFISDIDNSLYYTVTFKDGDKPIAVKLIRVDSPMVQAIKACQSVVGKKVKDLSGKLHNVDSVDVRQVYETYGEINKANIAKLRYSTDVQDVYIDGMWHDPISPVDTMSEGKLYFVNLYSETDRTSVGYVVKAGSFEELEKLIILLFDNTGEQAKVYDADTDAFISVVRPELQHP